MDNSLGKSCLVDGNPETCWTSQQARITSLSAVTAPPKTSLLGSSAIHPTSLFVPCHSEACFADLSRRICRHYLRCGHPISRCHQLARIHTHLPGGRESCTDVRSYHRRASERYQADFRREFGLFRSNNGIRLDDRGYGVRNRRARETERYNTMGSRQSAHAEPYFRHH